VVGKARVVFFSINDSRRRSRSPAAVDAPALPFCATHALVPPVFGTGLSVVSQSR
jgi:hypothetical protein